MSSMLNRYKKRSHISAKKFREVIRYFSLDFTATNTANLTKISRNSVNKIYSQLRQKISLLAIEEQEKFSGEVELDESYFGAKRVRGKRGRGAAGKTPVFGLLKRDGKVFVQIVKNCTRAELMPIIQGKILEGSTINTDGWKAYDGLILNGYTHHRVYHSHNEFARGKNHVNGIESFWSFCKRRLSKFNGLTDEKFLLHLKESQFRFNNRKKTLYPVMLKILKKNPI